MNTNELATLITDNALNLRPASLIVTGNAVTFIIDELTAHHVTAYVDGDHIVDVVDGVKTRYTPTEYIQFLKCE